MSLVTEIKCARCDRKYSGVRSRCPYCGARRIGRGKYTENSDNSRGKMLISILVMGVLVVAAGVLLFTTAPDADAVPNDTAEAPPSLINADDITQVDGANQALDDPLEDDGDDPLGEPTPVPGPTVTSVVITHHNRRIEDFTQPLGQPIELGVRIEPVGVQEDIIWLSGDSAVFEVVPLNPEGTSARITGVGVGHATLTVSVGGMEATCIVRIRR